MRTNRILLQLLLTALPALAGCGQTGALYLPDEGIETPVEIRSPGTPAATPATAPASKEEDKDGDQPPGR